MHATAHEPPVQVDAPYVAELVRQEMIARFGGDVVNKGYHVTTTIDSTLQTAANLAVRDGLLLYDHRHGWHGVEKQVQVGAGEDAAALAEHLRGLYGQAGLLPAIVASTGADGSATVVLANRSEIVLPAGAAKWTNKTPASWCSAVTSCACVPVPRKVSGCWISSRAASPRWSRWMPTAAH